MPLLRSTIIVSYFVVSLTAAYADPLICFGDSQTVGLRPGVVAGQEWCALLAKRGSRQGLNKGVGGNTTDDALARINEDVLSQPGSCVTVMFGANDGWRDPRQKPPLPAALTPERYRDNLLEIVRRIKSAGKKVTLMTPWPFMSVPTLQNMAPYIQVAKDISTREQVPLIDVYTSAAMEWFYHCEIGEAKCEWFSNRYTDYQHPSAGGNLEIASLCELSQNKAACACIPEPSRSP